MPDVIQQIFKRLAVPLPDAPEVTTLTTATDACLAQLPTDLLHHLLRLGLFTARDLSALACACRRLASIAAAHVPSLLPKLYEHQRASLRWMRACEGRAGAEGAPPRGGVLADEPGLGKTVTVLSLVLKTAGARPAQLPEDVDDGAADKWASYDVVDRERWALAVLNHASRPPPRVWELIAPLARTFHTLDAFEGACRAAAGAGIILPPNPALETALADVRRKNAKRKGPPPARARGTLVVAPGPLLDHWQAQIALHVDGCGGAGGAEALRGESFPGGGVYVDATRSAALPNAAALSQYGLVLTSMERLSREWQRHKEGSALLQVRWLRLVIDEGHVLGGGGLTHRTTMMRALRAERRWVMSGTPAKETSLRDGLASLHGILAFVRHPLGVSAKAWQQVAAPLLRSADAAAAAPLEAVLSELLVRHEKSATRIPPPLRRTVRLRCSAAERLAYNTVVGFARANVLLTAMEGAEKSDGWEMSLLNPENHKEAKQQLANIRLACNGGGRQRTTLEGDPGERRDGMWYYHETLSLLRDRHKSDEEAIERVEAYMQRRMPEFGGGTEADPCDKCGIQLQLLLVTPCGHLLCPECVDHEKNVVGEDRCAHCHSPFEDVYYDECAHCDAQGTNAACSMHMWPSNRRRKRMCAVDAFVWLQPGFNLHWSETLQEAQASQLATQLERERQRRRALAGAGGAPSAAAASPAPAAAPAGDGGGEASSSSLAAPSDSEARSYTKFMHIAQQLEELRDPAHPPSRPLKVVIYSEHRKALDFLGHFLLARFGPNAVAQHWGPYRATELRKFVSGGVDVWRCRQCAAENEASEGRCGTKVLTLRFHNGGGVFDVNEQRVREYAPGIQWHFGQQVAAPMPGQPQNLLWGATVEAGGIKRCRGRYDAAVDALERRGGCFVLLLTRDGSHGLDLSMTSHLYLLEKIWDPAIEAQVVARACRLGATGSAVVEQLVMKGTVEEMLLDIHAQQHGEAAAAAAAPPAAASGGGAGPSGVAHDGAPRPMGWHDRVEAGTASAADLAPAAASPIARRRAVPRYRRRSLEELDAAGDARSAPAARERAIAAAG